MDQLSSVGTTLSITDANGVTTTLDPYTTSNATASIHGQYGTLTIGVDGAYSYTLNPAVSLSTITEKETFNYTLTSSNGQTANATLTVDMAPQFVSSGHNDVITGTAYADTAIYHLLNAASNTGGNGSDVWSNFSLQQGDKIDIHELLVGWNGQTSTLGNYLSVTTSGNDTVISIDRDGASGQTYQSTTLITLENVHTTLDELIEQHHIITH
nr:type I secretion C-terminal target domain-containing protein [Leminorella grimontii]